MSTDNLSAVLHGIEDLRLEQRSIPKFSDDGISLLNTFFYTKTFY